MITARYHIPPPMTATATQIAILPAGSKSEEEHGGGELARHGAGKLPALFVRSEAAGKRFVEYFTAHIRNRNTRTAYFKNVSRFSEWCDARGLVLERVQPIHVAAYIEELGRSMRSRP